MHRVALRYKETLFGFGWIFLQSVALTVIFTYIFHRFAKIPSVDAPYPLFAATGLIAWSLTALVVSHSISAVVSHYVILKRVSFPRIVLPFSVIVATLIDLVVMAFLLVGLFLFYRIGIPRSIGWLPLLLLLQIASLTGLSCLFSLANVFLRDVGQAIPFLLQLWFFVSPVFYSASMVPREFRELARWNPMTGLIEGYRSILLSNRAPSMELLAPAAMVSIGVLVVGVWVFRRLEGTLADLL